jgi:large subunit ribosomal protein L30
LAGKVRVTWKKSAIGYREDQKRTIQALGLRRLGHSVEHDDSRAVRGMIHKVRHLVEVSEGSGN